MALSLEALLLLFCVILIGYGITELKKRGGPITNGSVIVLGFALAAFSVYMTTLFLQS